MSVDLPVDDELGQGHREDAIVESAVRRQPQAIERLSERITENQRENVRECERVRV